MQKVILRIASLARLNAYHMHTANAVLCETADIQRNYQEDTNKNCS